MVLATFPAYMVLMLESSWDKDINAYDINNKIFYFTYSTWPMNGTNQWNVTCPAQVCLMKFDTVSLTKTPLCTNMETSTHLTYFSLLFHQETEKLYALVGIQPSFRTLTCVRVHAIILPALHMPRTLELWPLERLISNLANGFQSKNLIGFMLVFQ
jgi:hypothetical protein